MDDATAEMVRRLGACPLCGARWSVVEDRHGKVEMRGTRAPTPFETRFEVLGAVRICLICGHGVDSSGMLIRRR